MKCIQNDRCSNSGQSETIGTVLLFGMTFVAISTILVIGAPVIDDARENAQLEKTQVELATLDQQIRESVYTQDSPGGSITLSEGGISVKPESLTVNFTYDNGTGTTITNTTPGGMEYEHENMGVAYQNGGIWTEYRTGGTTVQSPPDMTYTGRTLTVDLLNFTNTVEVSGSGTTVSILNKGVNVTKFSEITNDVSEGGNLVITVGTEYSEAWAEHLNRTGIEDVAVSGDRVRAEMRTGPPIFAVEYLGDRYEGDASALPICLSPPLPSICSGSTTNVSLYDSRIGNVSDYSYTVDTDTVVSPSGVDDPIDPHPVTTTDIADIIASPPAGLQTFPSSPAVVDEGEYEVSSSSDNLKDYTFDTAQGSITLYVTGGSSLNIKNVSVEGGSPVYVYAQDPDIDDPGVNADGTGLFQLYTNDGSLTIEADYNGTVYAPDADVEIDTPSAGEVRGAVIAEDVKVDPGVEYYHDTSLRQAELPDELNPPLSRFKATERFLEIR